MAPRRDDAKPNSSLGFQYPTLRDHPLHTPDIWLEGKRIDDNIGGLWRIHDNLYDFSDFIKQHPGGSDWLTLSKGTDITEAFESHHLSGKPEKLLVKYLVKKAKDPRKSPFTFKEDGFYKTLKRKVIAELPKIPETKANYSKIIADSLLLGLLATSLLATTHQSYTFGGIAAICLTFVAIAAHNFFHQKDNFRMYYFDLTLMSSRGWRVSHVLSHHLYTNTVYDLEISTMEPMLQFLPHKKNFFFRYISWIYSPIFYASIYIGYYIRLILQAIRNGQALRTENYLPLIFFMYLFLMGNQPFLGSVKMFFFIQFFSSLLFGVIGINGAHHHPDIFHDGDMPRPKSELDWGIHQLDTVMDRTEITGSPFWILVTFGEHGLHHLFPTLDHGKLPYLYPVFERTCEDYGVKLKKTTSLGLAMGQFRQLSKVEPNPNPPTPCRSNKK